MSLKHDLMKKGLEVMSDPRVSKLMQNEQVMKAVVGVLQVSGKVNTLTTESAAVLAKTLKLATRDEMKELRRSLKKLEREVAELKAVRK